VATRLPRSAEVHPPRGGDRHRPLEHDCARCGRRDGRRRTVDEDDARDQRAGSAGGDRAHHVAWQQIPRQHPRGEGRDSPTSEELLELPLQRKARPADRRRCPRAVPGPARSGCRQRPPCPDQGQCDQTRDDHQSRPAHRERKYAPPAAYRQAPMAARGIRAAQVMTTTSCAPLPAAPCVTGSIGAIVGERVLSRRARRVAWACSFGP